MNSPLLRPPGLLRADPSHPAVKGLVSWWPLGIGGTKSLDIIGTNHALLPSAISFAPGARGGLTYKLNGTNQNLDAGTGASLAITSTITVSCWFNINSVPANNAALRYQLVCKGYNGTNTGYFIEIDTNNVAPTANSIFFGTFNGSGGGSSVGGVSGAGIATTNLVAGVWMHALGTYDGVKWKFYLNGVQRASSTDTNGPSTTTKGVLFGAQDINGSISDYFPGSLENIRIYNRALSDPEIWNLYAEPWQGILEPRPIRRIVAVPPAGTIGTASSTSTVSGVGVSAVNAVGTSSSSSIVSASGPTRNILVRAPYLSTDTIETVVNQTLTLSATTGVVTATAGAASFASGDVGKYIRAGAGFGQITVFTSNIVVTLAINANGAFASTSITSGNWAIAPLSYQLYQFSGGSLVTFGPLAKNGFWLGSKDIPNCWYVKMPISPNGNADEIATLAVFGNINGSNFAAIEVNAPPTVTETNYNRIIIAPYQTGDTITTPEYKIKDIDGTPGSLVTTGIAAIPGITNGYAALLTQTPTADGIQGMELWDGG